ncbi:MAG: nucleotide exchange factor GrpE [Patescibacteria group bacterium]
MVKTKSLKDQIAFLDDKFKRALADYQNQEKRYEAQKSLLAKFANETLLTQILPVVDDLERAQSHLQDAGLGHVIKTFHQVLASEGVSIIESDQADFDPATMDCAEVVAGPKDKIVKTITKGYRLFDKVLRPAKVEVGDGTSPTEIPSMPEGSSNSH